LNWVYATLSIVLFAAQRQVSAQYTSSSSVYTPPPTSPYEPPPTPYPPPYGCTPSTLTVTTSTTLTSITTTTTTAFETIYSGSSYGYYDHTYVHPIKKKTALIIGLVIGLCGLALLLLIALLVHRQIKKNKVDDYGKGPKTYDENTTPATSY